MVTLVTGGAGFIGSNLAERLIARGDEIVLLDNFNDYYDPRIKRQNLTAITEAKGITLVEGDIRDEELVKSVFSQHEFDVVVHLAARAGVRASMAEPALYTDVNCTGTIRLLEAARHKGTKRFVFASSSSVYGGSATPPFREDASINKPLSPYAASKAAAELLCRTYYDLYGISCTALRFFTVYGPRQRPDMAIHKFTRMIDNGESIPFYGDGSSERDYTYISDILDGVVSAIDHDLGFEIINLGESQTTTLSRLVQLIEKNLGKKAVLDRQADQPGDMKVTCADIFKARQLLDYCPSTTAEEGIQKFVSWYRR